ncbi:S-adenosyl-L-methionine-dependent methyltransferase [Thozetella sp. PMI_491]|nr:S-adenosyl-L-methionine-dependent methyltransferase [Thozetella sp. PMI_491]
MAPSDPTFRSYSAAQAKAYASGRGSYSAALYDFILQHHQATGGQTHLLLDVGCGPGNATRDLAPCFDSAVGVDPGREMIDTAREAGGLTAKEESIRYHCAGAEDIADLDGVTPASVDLLTAAMSAHWFDIAKFWPAAAKLVKPGGTVAIWTHASLYCHPSTPNAAEVQRILSHLEDVTLAPHVLEPNRASRSLYASLPLPWHCGVSEFDKASFLRREWDVDGVLSDGDDFFGASHEQTLAELGNALGTASMVTRWRAANPDLAGTDQDCIKETFVHLRNALGTKDGDDDQVKLRTGAASVVLMIKKLA